MGKLLLLFNFPRISCFCDIFFPWLSNKFPRMGNKNPIISQFYPKMGNLKFFLCRGATIRVKSKGRKSSTMRRPVQRLYPSEICEEETDHTGACASPNPSPAVGQPRRNPRRQAAVDAENRRRAWIQELI